MIKKDVTDEIDLIAGQSYTTAETVREVLNTMLNYSEERIDGNVKTIEENKIIVDDLGKTVIQQGGVLAASLPRIDKLEKDVKGHELRIRTLESEIPAPTPTDGYLQFDSLEPIKDSKGLMELRYSFVIVPEKSANYTFHIKALKDITSLDTVNYLFQIKSELTIELSKFLTSFKSHRLSYVVSISNQTSPEKDYQKLLTTTFEVIKDGTDQGLVHRFYPYNIIEGEKGEELIFNNGDEIFTSIVVQCPAFTLER